MESKIEHIRNVWTYRQRLFWMACTFLPVGFGAIASGCNNSTPVASPRPLRDTSAVVKYLGTDQDPNPNETVRFLHSDPRNATMLLANELRIIDPDKDGEIETCWHMIWCIAALRSITGQEFTFKTGMTLNATQREALDAREPLPYFVERMANARVYIAPQDVQTKIVAAWREWTRANASTFVPEEFQSYRGLMWP